VLSFSLVTVLVAVVHGLRVVVHRRAVYPHLGERSLGLLRGYGQPPLRVRQGILTRNALSQCSVHVARGLLNF
jgi:hypothetical protein